jgi:hypothetical protein
VEDDDFGFERGDCQTVTVTGGLGRMDETLHGGSCVGDEAEVVDVEKDNEEGHGVRVRESQVGMVTLDGMDEVGDVESSCLQCVFQGLVHGPFFETIMLFSN